MTDTNINKVLKQLERAKMTDAERIGSDIGEVIANIIVFLIATTVFWSVLHFLIGFAVTWPQVFGGYLILNFVKNSIARALKGS